MRTSTSLRTAASVMLCGLVIAACGQKAGVRVGDEGLAAGQTGVQQDIVAEGTQTDSGTVAAPTDTATISKDAAATGGAAGATDTSTGGQQATGGQQQTTGAQQPSGGEQSGAQQPSGGDQSGAQPSTGGGGGGGGGGKVIGNDRTGAPEDRIVIGLHAPATGAAPLPTTSFEKARDTYWRYVIEKQGQKVLGRSRIDVLFQDDKYDPNSAGQVCQRLASEAFMVVGGGGTDQIQRCGQLAQVGKFPYFSAGVTEAGLDGNPWYFAASMTYRQQGGLLAQYIAKNPDGKANLGGNAKIGVIITDTPNFKDAETGFLNGLKANGLQVAKLKNGNPAIFRHTKNDKSWINGVARDFSQAGVNTLYFLSAPTIYLDFVNAADSTFGYNPTYVGVGVSKGLNAVLKGGCKAPGKRDDNGIFLSPFPGLDRAPAEFKKASAEFGAPADDIALALWGLAEGQHKMFQKYASIYGNDLERETFRAFAESQMGAIKTSVYPTVQYSSGAGGHFGANSAHVLEANCDIKQYETLHAFASGF